jgi:hypothetical protein
MFTPNFFLSWIPLTGFYFYIFQLLGWQHNFQTKKLQNFISKVTAGFFYPAVSVFGLFPKILPAFQAAKRETMYMCQYRKTYLRSFMQIYILVRLYL